jgi:integrase
MPVNPAAAVRGPRHIVRRGKTSVLDPAEARQLIDAINTSTVIGLCDRAFVGLMVYSFARIDAAIGLRVEDVYTQNRRGMRCDAQRLPTRTKARRFSVCQSGIFCSRMLTKNTCQKRWPISTITISRPSTPCDPDAGGRGG